MALQIMGEAAVTAFLQSVLQDLAAVIAMGRTLFLDFDRELKKMEKILSRFQDLLVDGERRRLGEKSVDKWMDDLKDMLYDADDLVDEIKLERQHLDLTTKSQPSNIQVHNNFSNIYGRSNSIKSRICCVLDRLDELTQEADSLKLSRDIVGLYANWTMPHAMSRRETGPSIDESEMHGREKDTESLVDMLLATDARSTSTKKYDVICLVGMGGLGKTTLAQLIFQDQRVENAFEVKSWACVSDVFDVTKVTKELVEYAAPPGMYSTIQSLAALQASLKSIVNNKRFLFVLDDVWTTKEWDKLKAPFNFGAKGSKILVTTRMKKVADGISNKAPYPLGLLDYEHCWAIFRDKAFEGIDVGINQEEMMKMGKAIVEKCGGVPLAVKVIGAMLRGAEEGRWKAILQNELWHSAFENDEIHPALRLSYYYLPAFLKRCFEYFAIFPSDYWFEQDKLVRMWIAEGLIEVKEGTLPEIIGNQYYNDLKGRSLIQENDKMHDIIHHLARIASGKFFYQAKSGSNSRKAPASVRHASFRGPFHDGKTLELIVDANNLCTLIGIEGLGGGPHEQIWSYKILRVLDLPDVRNLSELPSSIGYMKHLRYINLAGCGLAGDLPDSICTLSNLQVLDLSLCGHLQNLPKDMGNLFNLWYLDISHTRVSSLPESIYTLYNLRVLDLTCIRLTHLAIDIGNLQNLQILKLRGSSISSVPESILNVTSLHVLEIDVGCELPPHIRKLTGLEVLTSYTVGKEKGRGINELKDLNRLKGSLCIDRMENIGTSEEASMVDLKSKKHIVKLEFHWIDGSEVEINGAPSNSLARDGESKEVKILEALEPHGTLKTLAFVNYGGQKLPNWMYNGCLRNLVGLEIAGLGMMERVVGVQLPSLKKLTISSCPVLREVSMATPKLTTLTLEECRSLKAASLVLLPSFSDDIVVVHFLAHQLEKLNCEYYYLDWFLGQVQASATNATRIKLKKLTVDLGQLDDKVTCLPSGLTSLESLSLVNLPSANFLLLPPNCDDQASSLLSLRDLSFLICPNLTCMPSDLHKCSSLRNIHIIQCPGLISLHPQDVPVPADHLEYLLIINCEHLRNLHDGFSNFTSLQALQLLNCPNLEFRPHDALPPNLVDLLVVNCPKLEEQLEREGRTDWQSRSKITGKDAVYGLLQSFLENKAMLMLSG